MPKLLIATTNPAKVDELRHFLQPIIEKGVELVSLEDVDITEEPEETGTTIEENAILKAKYYAEVSGLPSLADDGGFEIDALNGEPGVKSNRWLGYKASDEELINHTLKMMEGVPQDKRQARLKLCLCYFNPNNQFCTTTGSSIEGRVSDKVAEHYVPGFPFRAVHIVEPFNKYYDELTEEEHEQANHRRKAVLEIAPQIASDLLK